MKKLSSLPVPALAGVVRQRTVRSAICEIKNCLFGGADMIDLHLSCLEKTDTESLHKIIAASRLPVLALHYNDSYDRKKLGLGDEERVACMLRAVDAGAAGIDMQGYTFDAASKDVFRGEDKYSFTKDAPKEVVTDPAVIERQRALVDEVHGRGAEVLLSCHPGVPMNTEQVVELALFLEQRKPDIIKIVTKAQTEDDMLEAIKTMRVLKREVKTPVSYHASGKAGALTRVLNPVLGGQIAFCVDRYGESATLEQLDLRTVRTIVDNMRKIYGE